jgi:phosphohistidine phosphatase
MRLYLVQHGDAVAEAVDAARPLSPDGARAVRAVAQACARYGVKAREVLHSGKLRARQSAEILGEELGIPVRAVAGIEPLDPAGIFASECGAWEEPVVIAGHLPFLERLTALLVAGREEPAVAAFQRGGMICLEKRGGSWTILWTALPEQPHIVAHKGGA